VYNARSGYLGSDLSISGALDISPSVVIFSGISWNNFSGAANEDSPLFETDNSVNSWFGIVWRAKESKRRVITQ